MILTEMTRLAWCQNSTWHGVPDLYNSGSSKGKIFWILSLTVTTSIATWQITRLMQNFFNGSSYSTSEIIENVGHLPFPNVTVCNYNRANISRMQELGLDEDSLEILFSASVEPFLVPISMQYQDNSTGLTALKAAFDRFNRSYPHVQIIEFLGHDCVTSLLGCWWLGFPFNCCEKANVIINTFGKCFSIIPSLAENSNIPEQNMAGKITLFLTVSVISTCINNKYNISK